MKKLLVCLSSYKSNKQNRKTVDSINETNKSLVKALQSRGVIIKSVMPNKIKFHNSTLMKDDVEYLVKNLEYNFNKIPGITYPTNKLSDNGKDEEYYLNGLFEGVKINVSINVTAGIISIFKDW